MKIAYIDISTDGHHITYLSALTASREYESILILPKRIDNNCKQYVFSTIEPKKRNLKTFLRWADEIYKIVEKEKPDIVHFLYGDAFYRFFGAGLERFKKYKTIVTLHWARSSIIEKISTKLLCSKVDKVVVHSKYIQDLFHDYGIKNVEHIEYPQFNERKISKEDACEYWNIDARLRVIACIGNTRYDKGLDILLEALKKIKIPFQLLVAGKAETFDEEYILKESESYRDRVKICLKYLSEDELSNALCACDIVVLPYRKIFNGASGPLGEGVALDKCIVGPDHGTLGYTIKTNHLGYTFESENVDELARAINKSLTGNFVRDEFYEKHKNSLKVQNFVEKYSGLYNNF